MCVGARRFLVFLFCWWIRAMAMGDGVPPGQLCYSLMGFGQAFMYEYNRVGRLFVAILDSGWS